MRIPALIGATLLCASVANASPETSEVLHGPGRAPVSAVAVIDGPIAAPAASAAGIVITQRLSLGGRTSTPVAAHARGVAEALGQACPGCRVINVAVTRASGGEISARDEDLARAIDMSVRRGARTVVIAMGYEGRCTPALSRAIRAAQRRALIVAAAGNDARARGLPCPARMAGVVAVGALGPDGAPAPYASLRTGPALWALGEVSESHGSSFAAPRVAGVAASLAGSPAQRRAALMSAAMTSDGRRILRAPGDVQTRAAVVDGALIASVAPGQALSVCISLGAPDPRLWRAGLSMPLAPGVFSSAAGGRWEIMRITGDPGVRAGACG